MAVPPFRVLSVCSGIGGLDLGLRLAVPHARTVLYCERDYAAVSVLVRRIADGALDDAPIWSDVSTLPAEQFAGRVDAVIGGIPCQPFSVAGTRKGTADERWIWRDVLATIREVRPRFVFLENVPGFVRHGLPIVAGDLAALGFAAEWDLFSAAQVGAPHKRERFFLLAYRDDQREQQPQGIPEFGRRWPGHRREEVADSGRERNGAVQHVAGTSWAETDAWPCGSDVAHANGTGLREHGGSVAVRAQLAAAERGSECMGHATGGGFGINGSAPGRNGHVDQSVATLADTRGGFVPQPGRGPEGRTGTGSTGDDVGAPSEFTEREPDHDTNANTIHAEDKEWRTWGIPVSAGSGALFPPGPGDADRWREWLQRHPETEPAIRSDAARTADRLDQLFTLGNAVVPLVAAVAFRTLADRLGVKE